MSSPVLGIDLGTTNSVVAVSDGQKVRVLADEDGQRLVPSIVSFHPDGSVLIGRAARDRRAVDAPNTIASVKRLLGRPFESAEVRSAASRVSFSLKAGAKGDAVIDARGGPYALVEISAMVLSRMRAIAEKTLGETCTRAVITVPANFDELQRSATIAAAQVAGLEVLRIVNEPTAAALAYGRSGALRQRVAIYDLGGGTFDVTLLQLEDEVFEVTGTAGDTFLGGDDLDQAVTEVMALQCLRELRIDPRSHAQMLDRLRAGAEEIKCALSDREEAEVTVRQIGVGDKGRELDFRFRMTRSDLERLATPLLSRTFDVCRDVLKQTGRDIKELDAVLLVGGPTRMPLVRRMVAHFFQRLARTDLDPELVVAQGAAVLGHTLGRMAGPTKPTSTPPRPTKRSDRPGKRTLPHGSLAVAPIPPPASVPDEAVKIGRVMLTKSAPIAVQEVTPSKADRRNDDNRPFVFRLSDPGPQETPKIAPPAPADIDEETLFFEELEQLESPTAPSQEDRETLLSLPPADLEPMESEPPMELDPIESDHPEPIPHVAGPPSEPPVIFLPDEPVLEVPQGPPPLLMDVTPRSLGIETAGGYCQPLVKRNSPVPTEQSRLFTTSKDQQDSVHARICQGESKRFEENQLLGEIVLRGLQSLRRGDVKIQVTFLLDANGTLQVRAVDMATQQAQTVKIELLGGLSEDEIVRLRERQAQRMAGGAAASA